MEEYIVVNFSGGKTRASMEAGAALPYVRRCHQESRCRKTIKGWGGFM